MLKTIIERKNLTLVHQFGFRKNHSIVDQEEKKVCSTRFLHLIGRNMYLPKQYSDILQSFISERYFRIKYEVAYSELKEINAGVPQGSMLGPLLYFLYTCGIFTSENKTPVTFNDGPAILVVENNNEQAFDKRNIEAFPQRKQIRKSEAYRASVIHTCKSRASVTLSKY